QVAVRPLQVIAKLGMAAPGGTAAVTTAALRPLRPAATGSDTVASLAPTWTALAAAFHWEKSNKNSIPPNTSTNMNRNTMVTSTITAPRWSRPKLAASISVSHRCSIARSEYEAEITGARSRSTFKNPNEGSVNSVDAATV